MTISVQSHLRYLSPKTLVLTVCGSAIAGFCEAAVLALLALIGVAIASGARAVILPVASRTTSVTLAISAAIAIALFRLALQVGVAHMQASLTSTARHKLRERVFEAFAGAPWASLALTREGEFQERLTSHIDYLGTAAYAIATGATAAISFLVMVGSSFALDPVVASAITAFGALIFALLRPFSAWTRAKSNAYVGEHTRYAQLVSEAGKLGQEMTTTGTGEAFSRRHSIAARGLSRAYYPIVLLGGLLPAAYQTLALVAAVVSLAIVQRTSNVDVGALGGVVLLTLRALAYSQQVQSSHQLLQQLEPYVDATDELIDRLDPSPSPNPGALVNKVSNLELTQICFRYPGGGDALRNVTCNIPSGETIGIVGPSGAGKSTLVQIILRLRDPTQGKYVIDGTPACEYALTDWWQHVALVPQEPRLMTASVADNISFFRERITRDDVIDAAKRAHIHDEIESWTDGYDTVVSDRVEAISGGQRQRLCIARALAGRPDLLVLDEPTSSLDSRSEALIQASLRELKGIVTTVIVAHRLSSLTICDRIMVLSGGRVEAFDTPEALVETNAFFREFRDLARSSPGGIVG